MNKDISANIRKLSWISFLSSTQFQAVVATIFLLSKGFNLGQVFLLGSVYAVASLLSEIPTGSYSDRIGRKNSLVLATLIEIPALVVVVLTQSFETVVAMYALFGMAASFTSGTDTALLYETLQQVKKEADFKRITGRLKWLGSWGGAVGGILGGAVAKFDLSYAWWAWIGTLIIVLAIKATLVEPPAVKDHGDRIKFWLHFKQSVQQSFHGQVGFFVLYYVAIWLFFWLGYSLWQPYLQLIALPVVYFGFFYAGMSLVSGFASKNAHAIEARVGVHTSLLLIPLVLAAAFILQSLFPFIYGLLFIALHALASGYFTPALEDYVNTRISSNIRATVLSVQNMLSRLAFAIASPLIGYFIDIYSLTTALALMGCLVGILGIVFYFLFDSQKALTSQG